MQTLHVSRDPSATGGGLTLVELMVAITVLTLGVGAVTTALMAGSALSRTNRETGLALDACHNVVQSLKGVGFAEAFARYNADPADDPLGVSAPGRFFAVPGLRPLPADADGFVGEVQFPGDGLRLSEVVDDAELGMPRDLNGDGDAEDADVTGYVVLPVRVRVAWQGRSGPRSIELVTSLVDL